MGALDRGHDPSAEPRHLPQEETGPVFEGKVGAVGGEPGPETDGEPPRKIPAVGGGTEEKRLIDAMLLALPPPAVVKSPPA